MKDWTARRASAEGPNLAADLATFAVPDIQWLWDTIAPKLDTVLCGATREALDRDFPPDPNGLRRIDIGLSFGFVPARILFVVDDDDDERVVYYAARRLSPAGWFRPRPTAAAPRPVKDVPTSGPEPTS